jgi:hypothetical protein
MMTAGLVVTLDLGANQVALEEHPMFTLGEPKGDRLPVALEAEDAAASERWTEWLRQLPGVTGVEVVFVHWDVEAGLHDGD